MKIRDRVKGLRRVKAGVLKPHPRNWRVHPDSQRNALQGVLAEIGYAGALIARELADGSLQLIDGHLRAQTTPDAEVPVLVVDLDDSEAKKLLAVLDPLAAMADCDHDALAGLIGEVETENRALGELLDNMLAEPPPLEKGNSSSKKPGDEPPAEVDIPELFQVVVDCRDEQQQQSVYERLTADGLECRLMNL